MAKKRGKTDAPKAINFVAKHDFNVGGAHEDKRVTKKRREKHRKDWRYDH